MDEALTPMGDIQSSTEFDLAFREIKGLTWLPWVGRNFGSRPTDQRLLIVGESHYVRPATPEQLETLRQQHLDESTYTRAVVSECLVNQEWLNRTLDNVPRLLFETTELNRDRFWSDAGFYNLVQRPMNYNQEGQPERPTWDDFVSGWSIFADVVRLIQPSHCLFIGVEAANSFNYAMNHLNLPFESVSANEMIGRTYARVAKLGAADLIFVQHLGKYFSPSQWHEYLSNHHPALMKWLHAESYPTIVA